MQKSLKQLLQFTILLLFFSSQSVSAYNLFPEGTKTEQVQNYNESGFLNKVLTFFVEKGLPFFTEPVHEEITLKMLGCDNDGKACLSLIKTNTYASDAIIAGLRWNDDPPFRMKHSSFSECKTDSTIRVSTQPNCWYKLFKHAEAQSKKEYFNQTSKNRNLMYRSHFGDLQFLHSMASKEDETTTETYSKLMMWSEFAWKVATEQIKRSQKLNEIKDIEGFRDHFDKSGWNVQTLFTLGNPELRKNIDEVAYGSILHMIQDSFAKGHVDRAAAIYGETCNSLDMESPGEIERFHSYVNQDHDEHAKKDSRKALVSHLFEEPNVVDVGRELNKYFLRKSSWTEVKPVFQCIFRYSDDDAYY